MYSIAWLISNPKELYILPQLIEEVRKVGNDVLADGEKKVKAEGIEVRTLLREGHAVKLKRVEKENSI